MDKLTPVQKLDAVLEVLSKEYPQIWEYSEPEIFVTVMHDFFEMDDRGAYGSEFKAIYKKLLKDGYIQNLRETAPYYSITFEGYYFLKYEGGYVGQLKRINAENIRLEKVERSQLQLTSLTKVLAFAGLLAAAYYLILIGKHFHWWTSCLS